MKKKKGFTLIELLAVIVILAIIALIATPIVMNVIENSRKGAAERSAENYIDAVEIAVAAARLDGPLLADGTYTLADLESALGTIEVSGNKPTNGSVKIQDGVVVTDPTTTLKVGDYTVSYDAEGKITATKGSEVAKLCTYVPEEGSTAKTVGAKYTCNLGGEPRTFYVLEVGENPVDGSTLGSTEFALIMDRNINSSNFSWCVDGGVGNTCQPKQPSDYDASVNGWGVEVSLPSYNQLNANVDGTGALPSWLYNYLGNPENGEPGPYQYWTSTPVPGPNFVYSVIFNGSIFDNLAGSDIAAGLRPVITITDQQL